MASEKDLELLDDYIRERLSDVDRAAFENKLSGDADLQRELKFQQRITDGLRQARAAQLKTMLNNVPVAASVPAQTTMLAKVAGGIVLTGLVATGIFFYVNRNESAPALEPTEHTLPNTADSAVADSNNTTSPESATPAPENRATAKSSSPAKGTSATPATSPDDKIKAYNPADEQTATESTAPQASTVNAAIPDNGPSVTTEIDRTNSKYTFHYQFKDGKLMLYGAFEKNLYEILEIFSDNKRTTFLFYKSNYYLLNEQGEDIKALAPIRDEALLQKLSEYRKNQLGK